MFRIKINELTYTVAETACETPIEQFIETRNRLVHDISEARERLDIYLNQYGYVFSEIEQTPEYREDLKRYRCLKDELGALLVGVSWEFLETVRQYERGKAH